MNQKQIAFMLIAIGIILVVIITAIKVREDNFIDSIIDQQEGSCYLEDGTCLHADRDFVPYIIGYVLAAALMILGIYLLFFDKTQQQIMSMNQEVSTALKEAKEQEKTKDEFNAFLAGFSEQEQKVLKAVKEQEGILQSTLRYRTGTSKTSLSLMLKDLEKKEIISRKKKGKTNAVYLMKKF